MRPRKIENLGSGAIKNIIVVGAGPSGMLLAIMLAKAGIRVQVVEATHETNNNPRAAHYAPSASWDFDRAGVLDEVSEQGFFPDSVCWRWPDGEFLAGINLGAASEQDYPMVVLPLDRLIKLFYNHLVKLPHAEVLLGHKVVSIDQDGSQARIVVETDEGQKTMTADYIVGADGASSRIRRCLLGDEYPGETLPQQIIATNVYYDFRGKHDYWDSNFIISPDDWYMAARITDDGCWRVTYGDIAGLTKEEYLERQPMRFEKLLPALKPGTYKLTNASPYKLQQRCAPTFRVGRFVLVADAAHLCNPFGGMGLTGGFGDVGSLYDCLAGIHQGLADEDILDKYSEVRIKIWKEMIDPISRGNFRRLWDEEAIPDRNQFIETCKRAAEDKEMARELAESIHAIRHDFTQYYKSQEPSAATIMDGVH